MGSRVKANVTCRDGDVEGRLDGVSVTNVGCSDGCDDASGIPTTLKIEIPFSSTSTPDEFKTSAIPVPFTIETKYCSTAYVILDVSSQYL